MHDPDAYSSVPDEFDDRGLVDVELPSWPENDWPDADGPSEDAIGEVVDG